MICTMVGLMEAISPVKNNLEGLNHGLLTSASANITAVSPKSEPLKICICNDVPSVKNALTVFSWKRYIAPSPMALNPNSVNKLSKKRVRLLNFKIYESSEI